MNMSADEIQKMKVVELRAELTIRSLDTRGVKAILVDRLVAALEKERIAGPTTPAPTPKPVVAAPIAEQKSATNNTNNITTPPVQPVTSADSPLRSTRSQPPAESPTKTTVPTSPVKATIIPTPAASASPVIALATSPAKPAAVSPTKVNPVVVSPVKVTPAVSPVRANPVAVSPVKVNPVPLSPVKANPVPVAVCAVKVNPVSPVKVAPIIVAPPVTPTKAATKQVLLPVKVEVESPKKVVGSPTKAAPIISSVKEEVTDEAMPSQDKPSEETAIKEEAMETEEGKEVASKRKAEEVNGKASENVAPTKKIKTEPPKPKPIVEDEPEFEDKGVVLDWYQSDLNLKIDTSNFLKAKPIVFDEFPWAYCGAKATYGFTSGKLCFEATWDENVTGRNVVGKDDVQNRLRIGWSDLYAELQLGEENFSYGFDSHEGKFYNAGEVEDGGETFSKSDVITAYLDLDSDPIEFKFAKNGTLLEKSIQVPKADVEGKVWFPHILSRNTSFVVNFGQDEPSDELLEEYVMVDKVDSCESKVRGPQRANSRAECEFVMLCGLAGAGKTKWAKNYKAEHVDKHFLILGTSTVVDRIMKKGTAAPKTHDVLLSKAGRFTEKLMELAATRRRNYILDQSNLLPNVQRRKTAGFEGFRRRAVVIIPPEEEYQTRIKSREQEQGKSVPKTTLLDMKGCDQWGHNLMRPGYRLPEVGEIFAEVEFAGVTKEEAEELVKTYNKEGTAAGFGQKFQNNRGGGRFFRGGRGGPPGFPRGGVWRGAPRGRPPPLSMRGSGMRGRGAPIIARVSRNPPARGFVPRGRGGPPPRGASGGSFGGGSFGGGSRGSFGGVSRGASFGNNGRGGSYGGVSRDGPPRGARGGGSSWVRGSSAPIRPLFAGRGGAANGSGGRPFAQSSPNVWSSQPGSPFGQAPRFGGTGGGGGVNRQSSNQGGGFQNNQPWGQSQNWGRGSNNSNGGGFGGSGPTNQFADPWVQQVPDQGYGQSWDNSRNNMGGGGMGANRGGGTWQGYGGQTYNNFNSGGGGGYRRN